MTAVAGDVGPAQDSGALLSGYEDLRGEALVEAGGSRRGIGLALFIRRGMAAWIAACAPVARPAQPTPRKPTEEGRLPQDLRAEVAMILAEMAFTAAYAEGASIC